MVLGARESERIVHTAIFLPNSRSSLLALTLLRYDFAQTIGLDLWRALEFEFSANWICDNRLMRGLLRS
jgi:hypothetical protein